MPRDLDAISKPDDPAGRPDRFDPGWPWVALVLAAAFLALYWVNDTHRRVREKDEAAAKATTEMRQRLREAQ